MRFVRFAVCLAFLCLAVYYVLCTTRADSTSVADVGYILLAIACALFARAYVGRHNSHTAPRESSRELVEH